MTIDDEASKTPQAAVVAAIVTAIFITAATITADLFPPLKAWLASTFTHHWIGKGILATGIFTALFLFLFTFGKGSDNEALAAQVRFLNVLAILGSVIIIIFFVYEAFLK